MFLTPSDCHLWNEGHWRRAWEKLGARAIEQDGVTGFHFAVWAPGAERV